MRESKIRFVIKRIAILPAISLLLNIVVPSPAIAAVVDCFDFGTPYVSSSTSQISISVQITARCTTGFGTGRVTPIYSISEENSSSSTCSGPEDFSLSTFGYVTCSINIGGPLPSSRVGSSYSTLKIWFPRDFSTKFITFSHTAIPSKKSPDIGVTPNVPSKAPVVQNCSGAPNTPELAIAWTKDGTQFTITPSSTGQSANGFYWGYALFDIVESKFGTWQDWALISPPKVFTKTISLDPTKSKVAFAAYSANNCGQSVQARESITHTGVPLAPLAVDSILQTVQYENVADELAVESFARSILSLKMTAYSFTPDTCIVRNSGSIYLVSTGSCSLGLSSEDFQNKLGAKSTRITFSVVDPNVEQTNTDTSFSAKKISIICIKGKLTKKVIAIKPSCPKGYKTKK